MRILATVPFVAFVWWFMGRFERRFGRKAGSAFALGYAVAWCWDSFGHHGLNWGSALWVLLVAGFAFFLFANDRREREGRP